MLTSCEIRAAPLLLLPPASAVMVVAPGDEGVGGFCFGTPRCWGRQSAVAPVVAAPTQEAEGSV
jgi:hypothetical protein